MTAISFKSESSDDYLEISENETVQELVSRLKNEFEEEWGFLNVVLIKSTSLNVDELRKAIFESQMSDNN